MDWKIFKEFAIAFSLVVGPMVPIILFFLKRFVMTREGELLRKMDVMISTSDVQKQVKATIERMVEPIPKSEIYTHEMCFPNIDKKMFVPIIIGMRIPVLENIVLCGISQDEESTMFSMVCDGHGHIGQHSHGESHEEIRVQSGVMTCLQTGTQYRKGDVWDIPPHEFHSATFQDVVAVVVIRPPLPTAEERPVNLDAMELIFD